MNLLLLLLLLCQVRRPGRDHLVESAADSAAGDDSRGFEHPKPGLLLQHEPGHLYLCIICIVFTDCILLFSVFVFVFVFVLVFFRRQV